MNRFFRSPSLLTPSPAERIVSYVILIFWTFVALFPIYWLAVTSLKLPIDVAEGPKYIPFVDFEPSLHAWNDMLFGEASSDTMRAYGNTLIVAPVSAALALTFGAGAAYGLVRFKYSPKLGLIGFFLLLMAFAIVAINLGVPWIIALVSAVALFIIAAQTIGKRFHRALGNNDIAFWLISQRMLPPIAVVIPIYVLFQRLSLLDTRTALIVTYLATNLPIVVWLMRDYFQTIPIELEESAAIDGASRYRIFWSVVLPLAMPGLVATFLFVLVFTWNEYLLGLFLAGADSTTLPILVAAQNNTRGPQWWSMSVLILIMIIPVILLAFVLERYIARGLLIGSVKG